ncbi:hypothetical protein B0A48_05732 [Cryoendolithus antarcticus]|uniref:Telomerase reverse transcriptase n=1 Tax=Cryoendolithus antarcticus TaxID=1507870 RepID=A0A1V8TCB6_9PEZI|nr:hypothetical protein B0A48_05732 [Cryoendolithus antarcticus]
MVKRKRGRPAGSQPSAKRQRSTRTDLGVSHDPNYPTKPLLAQYYSEVHSLRTCLVSRLPKSSKKRRRRLLQYGRDNAPSSASIFDTELASLLDTTIVGTSEQVAVATLADVENEISVFTQQLTETDISVLSNTGSLQQSEIVDLTVWRLFKRDSGGRRPAHLLCLGFQRSPLAANGDEVPAAAGIPGVYLCGPTRFASQLRAPPWTGLCDLLGRGGDRIISELLMYCGLFSPINGSSNVMQICGTPMSELKAAPRLTASHPTDLLARVEGSRVSKTSSAGISEIRFLRHRMLYAKPLLKACGRVRYGLSHAHVFSRCRNIDSASELVHVMQHMFPRQFRLHNVFTSTTDRMETAQQFRDYTNHVLHGLSIQDIHWLAPLQLNPSAKLSRTDWNKRTELLAELMYYLFDSFLIPLIRSHFHVTEVAGRRNELCFFRHDVWKLLSEPALAQLKETMLEECCAKQTSAALAQRALGISTVRLLPKDQGMRPIINLRRRVQRLRKGQLVLGRSINSVLTPAFSVLNYEKANHPDILSSAMFSVDDVYTRLQDFRARLDANDMASAPLYFAKVDVKACFDTIPQKRLMQLATELLTRESYHITKYARATLLGGHDKNTPGFVTRPSWKYLNRATGDDEVHGLDGVVTSDVADGHARTAYVHGAQARVERRTEIISLLREHIESNVIKLGNRYYRQKEGIPQGSIVSSLLCSYFYGDLEQKCLGFIRSSDSLLLRLIDDFLVITTDRGIAQRFMQVMHSGLPEFGVQVKAEKSRVNFNITIAGEEIPEMPLSSNFPYCGLTINTSTLDLSKDMQRRRNARLDHSVTIEHSKIPGQAFYRKSLSTLKLQMRTMLLSTSYNSVDTVLVNLYHCFSEAAQKMLYYIRALPIVNQPPEKLVNKIVNDMIDLACVLMKRRKPSARDSIPYECAVTPAQARWLACDAFLAIFGKRQAKFAALVAWLMEQSEKIGRVVRAPERLRGAVESADIRNSNAANLAKDAIQILAAIAMNEISDEQSLAEGSALNDLGFGGTRRGSLSNANAEVRHEYFRALLKSGSTVWSSFGTGEKSVNISVPETAVSLGRPFTPHTHTRRLRYSPGYRSLMMSTEVAEAGAIDTAPSSPPDLTSSKSSKRSSSSFHSLSDSDSTEKLAHFEDITLDEASTESLGDSNLRPESRPTLKRPPPRASSYIDIAKRNGNVRPSDLQNVTNGARRGYPSLQGAVGGALREQSMNLPHGRGMRRGFTSPSSPSIMMRAQLQDISRSPSPSKGLMNSDAAISPKSWGGSTPKQSCDGRPSNTGGMFGRRGSWQPRRKTVKELEAEYDNLDEEVPDEAILENVPITPIPGSSSRASRTPSPQRQAPFASLHPIGAHSTLHSANVPRNAKRPSAPPVPPNGRMRSPRSPKHNRPRMPHSATVGAFPPEAFGKSRAKSWTEDLNDEARQLSAALEEFSERHSQDNSRSLPGSTQNSPPRASCSSLTRSKTSIVDIPPKQKGNMMIDPLPISKEKEAVLTRTRPSWLPPKNQKEEKKHMKQWEQMMAKATEAEKRRESRDKAREEDKIELDGSLARVWEQHVLPNFDSVINEPRTREMWWRGVAPASRGQVWQRAIGNDLELSPPSFTAALARAESLESKMAAIPHEERSKRKEAAWFNAIARDVPSVFPEMSTTAPDHHKSLADVLKAYALYRSDVGYVYGTHLIAGLLCLNLRPADAFVALANLLNRPLPLAFLIHDQGAMTSAYEMVLSTLQYKSPNLHSHLTSPTLGLGPEDYLDPLFRCLFAYNVPYEHVARIWDVYVFEGDKALVRGAVAVLCKLESKLYGSREEVLDLLSWRHEGRWALGSEDDFMKSVREAGKMAKDA